MNVAFSQKYSYFEKKKHRFFSKKSKECLNVLIVDLNNFASFPTLAVGLLVAALRDAGHQVELICPLAYTAPATVREQQENRLDDIMRRVNLSTRRSLRVARDSAREIRAWWRSRPDPQVLPVIVAALEAQPDVVLLSAYLEHRPLVRAIGHLAAAIGTKVLLGGPMFNVDQVANAWADTPGLAALFGGEADLVLPDLVRAVVNGDDLLFLPGVRLPDGRASPAAPPLRRLDETRVPDFTDFPWDRYPTRVAPVLTGRGCQHGACMFCSDVISVGMRSFRSRGVAHVMQELREQSRRHALRHFIFVDLKLNSNPAMFRGIAENIQTAVPGAEWIGTVHVDQRADNGLSRHDIRQAVRSGMRRVSFGLETGSQRLLDLMRKGSDIDTYEAFIRDAHDAGLSVRATMFKGYPGETVCDLEKTAEFLERNEAYLDRVRFNEFSIMFNTPIFEALKNGDPDLAHFIRLKPDAKKAKVRYFDEIASGAEYRKVKHRVLDAVYRINRKPIRAEARAFDGMM